MYERFIWLVIGSNRRMRSTSNNSVFSKDNRSKVSPGNILPQKRPLMLLKDISQ